ncbi:hypothetical protein, partial [Desulfonatronospira sp.]|uniref:hypothetical protein n=1 Tax=Desulfonatronospira sp. TaxID=1962951 RepID=UPI0025C688A1
MKSTHRVYQIVYIFSCMMILILSGSFFTKSIASNEHSEFKIIDTNLSLTQDVNYEKDILMLSGTVNLNGHILTASGSIYHVGGTININEGKLIISHDYRLQSMEKDDEGNKKDSSGYLVMTGENDFVLVQGDFITQ